MRVRMAIPENFSLRRLALQALITIRETDRQTHRQTDTQTDRQTDRETGRQTDRQQR